MIRRRIDIAGVSQQQIYPMSLATYPWFSEDSIIELYDPQSNALAPLTETVHKWKYKENAESPAIEFPNGAPWATGETASMLVQCPANSWLKINGVWTNQTSPSAALATLTDESNVSMTDLIVTALAYVYRELAKWSSDAQASDWRRLERIYTARARNLPNFIRKQSNNNGIPNLNPTYSASRRYRQ